MSDCTSTRILRRRKKVPEKIICSKTKKIKEDEVSLIQMLSDDCLVKIFMFLPVEQRLSLESVCWRWYRVAKLAWYDIKKFDSTEFYYRLEIYKRRDESLFKFYKFLLLRCGRFLTHLTLQHASDSKIIPIIKDNCENLVQLHLELKKYHEHDFDEAFSNLKKLKSIEIKDFKDIHERIFHAFQSLPEEMEEIVVRPKRRPYGGCRQNPDEFYRCSDDIFIPTFQRFKSLRNLGIENFFITMNFLQIISQLENLTELDLSSSTFEENLPFPSFSLLKNIEKLTLYDIFMVDNVVVSASEGCKNLKYLDLSWTAVSDYAVGTLTKLEKLEVLKLQMETPDMSDIGDQSIGQFRNLKKLDCYSSERVTDNGMIELLKNSPNLEKLNVGFTSITLEGLQIAAEMTRHRKNNIVLRIHAYFFDLPRDFFKAPEYSSPFLVIENDLYK